MRSQAYAVVFLPALLLPVLLLAGCVTDPGSGPWVSPSPSTLALHGSGVARPLDKYDLQDLRTYAKSLGKPLKQVLAGQRGSRELDDLAAALESDADSGIVMAGHDPDQPGTAYMSFTHRPSEHVTAQLKALPLDTVVSYGLPLPHAELVRYSEALVGALDRVPGVVFLSCGPTALGNAVEVRYALTGTAPTQQVLDTNALQATKHWSTDGRLRIPVRFIVGALSERSSDLDPTGTGP